MDFQISSESLYYLIRTVCDYSSVKEEHGGNSSVLIDVSSDGTVSAAVYGAETSIKASTTAEVIQAGSITTVGMTFYSTMSSLCRLYSKSIIHFTGDNKKLTAKIKYKSTSGKITSLTRNFLLVDTPNFPPLYLPQVKSILSLSSTLLINALSSVFYAASKDKKQELFNSILIKLTDGQLVVAALEGMVIAETTVPIDFSGPEKSYLFRLDTLLRLVKALPTDIDLYLYEDKKRVILDSPNLRVKLTTVNDLFHDYEPYFDITDDYFVFDKEEMLSHIQTLMPEAIEDDYLRGSVLIEPDSYSLSCLRSYNQDIPCSSTSSIKIDLNLGCLRSILTAMPSEKVKIYFTDQTSPIKVFPLLENSPNMYHKALLVPMSDD